MRIAAHSLLEPILGARHLPPHPLPKTRACDLHCDSRMSMSMSIFLALVRSPCTRFTLCPNLRPSVRHFQRSFNRGKIQTEKRRNVVLYSTAGVLFTIAMTYAAVPLYRIYCLRTGLGGRAEAADDEKVKSMKKVDRNIRILFQADTESTLAWNFKPLQSDIIVKPGETALAFYTARNPLKTPVTGVATYNVAPVEAGYYLNKIQCFCFEEQRLNPNEQVDMPVFFFIDPEFASDPRLDDVESIVLNYVFYQSKEGVQLPFLDKIYNRLEGKESAK